MRKVHGIRPCSYKATACTWLKLLATPCCRMARQRGGAMAASVVMTPSMVAMLGWIMPDPLAMPPMRTGRPPMLVYTAHPR